MSEITPEEADHKEYVRSQIIDYLNKEFAVPRIDAFYIVRDIELGKIKNLTINFEVES